MDKVFVTGDIQDEMFRLRSDLMSFFNEACESKRVVEIGGDFDLKIVYLGEKHINGTLIGGRGRYDGIAKIWIQKNNHSNKVRYVIEIQPGEHWSANEPSNWPDYHIPDAVSQINSDPLLLLSKLKQLGVHQPQNLEQLLNDQTRYQGLIDNAQQQIVAAQQRHAEANINLDKFINEIKARCCEGLKWTFQALPRGWTQQTDSTGRPYYIDTVTSNSQWDRPVLPPGWTELTDPSSGRRYYSNGSKTQWEPPV